MVLDKTLHLLNLIVKMSKRIQLFNKSITRRILTNCSNCVYLIFRKDINFAVNTIELYPFAIFYKYGF